MSLHEDTLLWLDLETTGSDPEKDCIVELGAILTTPLLEQIGSSIQIIVKPTPLGLGRLMLNPVVREMHEANGLLPAILDGDEVVDISQAIAKMCHWLHDSGAEQGRTVLAGSGVAHFDRRFLDRYMPPVTKFLRYWSIDVGVLRRSYEMWTWSTLVDVNETKTHRALEDVRTHLREARAFHDAFRVLHDARREA